MLLLLLLLAGAAPGGQRGRPVATAQEQPAEAVDEEELASRRQGIEVEALCVHRVNACILAHGLCGMREKTERHEGG